MNPAYSSRATDAMRVHRGGPAGGSTVRARYLHNARAPCNRKDTNEHPYAHTIVCAELYWRHILPTA